LKSHISVYLEVLHAIYYDACNKCVAEVSQRDLNYIKSRVEKEGMSFLTITLPSFASDFEKSLELMKVDSNLFRNFRKRRSIPAFLQGMTSRIFDIETGRINDDVLSSPFHFSSLVESIRQICLAFKKIELPCRPEKVRKAMDGFVEIENSFSDFQLSDEHSKSFDLVCSVLWDNIMGDIRLDMLVPRHGPGATADRISGNQKYNWRRWHTRLEPYFPVIDTCYSASCGELDYHSQELNKLAFVSELEEQPVKVTPVPKTLKGPRIIAIEPCCMQYAQQGLRDRIYSIIESYWLTAGHINFRDQSVNQSLALISSKDGRLATIDLSDASDRVPHGLAMRMFQSNPDVRDAIESCRSTGAKLPDGRIIRPLRKFASMGSALCFPIEAMYFYTICVVASLEFADLPVSRENVYNVSRDIYVYGDDIIVPSTVATTVLDYLTKYNCKVNSNKTFLKGNFRESCGVDAFGGNLVTPVYLRQPIPENRQQSHSILSWCSTARQLFKAGYVRASQLLFKGVESVLGKLPSTGDKSFVIGRNHYWLSPPLKKRWNRHYQRLEVRCWVPAPVYRTDKLEGYGALQKSLLKLLGVSLESSRDSLSLTYQESIDRYLSSIVQEDVKHLERSALYGAVVIKRRWVPASLVGLEG